MANLIRKTGTITGKGTNTSFTVQLTTIKTLVIYRETMDSIGLLLLCYDETNGSYATFAGSDLNSLLNRESKQLEVSGGGVNWSPYSQYARLANGKTYKWIAYGEE